MHLAPVEFDLELFPRARVDVIDVRRLVSQRFGDGLNAYPKALCCSFHTTAGYLDQGLATRLVHSRGGVMSYINVFRTMFPEGAGYEHDKIDRRTELTEAQKPEEPRNADSHLAFMAGALRTCVAYRNRPSEPVCFIDLDGVHDGKPRKRRTSVLGYSNEEPVAQARIVVPVSRPRRGLGQPEESPARHLRAVPAARGAARRPEGAYPAVAGSGRAQRRADRQRVRDLLMRHDLSEVLRDPLRFMVEKAGHMLGNPRAIPAKTLDYAKYDLVRVFNQLLDAVGLHESMVESVLARAIAMPASRFLRMKRSVSLLVSDRQGPAGQDRRRHLSEPNPRAVAPRQPPGAACSTSR